MLVKAPRAYALVAGAQQQQLQRMRGCVASIARGSQLDSDARAAIFNMAADIANAFAALINQQLLGHTGQRAVVFPHVSAQQGVSGSYFGAGAAPDAIVAALIDEILASEPPATGDQPGLIACLRALEFAAKHQLDVLRQAVPEDAYVDRCAVADAARAAVRLAEQHLARAAHLCQTAAVDEAAPAAGIAGFTTPTAKRSSSLAFSASLAALPGREGLLTSPAPNMAMSICSTVSRSTATSKRRRPGSARKLAKLHSALERAGRQLLD
ncbi:hypothetical protein H4R19_005345 [Coemansia spiralis]|nr:hypothetical protein H4R19_005345 [Coemansia spiralis]